METDPTMDQPSEETTFEQLSLTQQSLLDNANTYVMDIKLLPEYECLQCKKPDQSPLYLNTESNQLYCESCKAHEMRKLYENNGPTCSICLSDGMKERTFALTACGHTYHAYCLAKWLEDGTAKICPDCKTLIIESNENESNESYWDLEELEFYIIIFLHFVLFRIIEKFLPTAF